MFNQIIEYNGIGCFIKGFFEQAHQFGMNDERRTANMRNWAKASINHSKIESSSLNGEVKPKIK